MLIISVCYTAALTAKHAFMLDKRVPRTMSSYNIPIVSILAKRRECKLVEQRQRDAYQQCTICLSIFKRTGWMSILLMTKHLEKLSTRMTTKRLSKTHWVSSELHIPPTTMIPAMRLRVRQRQVRMRMCGAHNVANNGNTASPPRFSSS